MVSIEDFIDSNEFHKGRRDLVLRGYEFKLSGNDLSSNSGLSWEIVFVFRLNDGEVVKAAIYESNSIANVATGRKILDNAELEIKSSGNSNRASGGASESKKLIYILEKWLRDVCGARYGGPKYGIPQSKIDPPYYGANTP